MDNILKTYITKLLELQETRLKCINLGYNPSESVKIELELIKMALKELDKRW